MGMEYNTGGQQLLVRNLADTVSVANVDQIRVSDGSLTDLGGGDVQLVTGGSNWTVSGANIYRAGTADVGINKIPTETFDVLVGTSGSYQIFQNANYNNASIRGEDDRLTQIGASDDAAAAASIALGVRGTNDGTGGTDRGALGDTYVYSDADSNGLNIISQVGPAAQDDYIRLYAGDDPTATASMFITGRTAGGLTKGDVGIATETPSELLHVAGNIRVDGQSNSPIFTQADAASVALNFNNGSAQTITLTQNTAFAAPTNLKDGATYILKIVQDGVGSRIPTWNAVFKWEGGAAPTLSTAASAIDFITFVSDGSDLFGVAALNFS